MSGYLHSTTTANIAIEHYLRVARILAKRLLKATDSPAVKPDVVAIPVARRAG